MAKTKAIKLTKARVAEITPTDKPVDYPDSTLTGFLLRCQPTGRKVYYYRYRFNGVGKFLLLGSASELSVAEARDLASDATASVRKGTCPVTQRKDNAQHEQQQKPKTLSSYVDGPYKQRALLRTSGRGQESVNMIKKEFSSWLKLPLTGLFLLFDDGGPLLCVFAWSGLTHDVLFRLWNETEASYGLCLLATCAGWTVYDNCEVAHVYAEQLGGEDRLLLSDSRLLNQLLNG